jgi:transcriptional regulator GlxA family with amidase domain
MTAMLERPDKISGASPLPRGVRRALDAMRADIERGWSVPDLASVAGVSGRTLQRQFRGFLGKAPATALRDIRFEGARRRLLQGLPDAKVMDVALRCGFPHCGRFSIEYGRRYGESRSARSRRAPSMARSPASSPTTWLSR